MSLSLLAFGVQAQKGGGGPTLQLDILPSNVVDFGDVDVQSGTGTESFRIANNTANPVQIELPSQIGRFEIVAGAGSYSLASGSNVDVSVIYDPKAIGTDYVDLLVSPQLSTYVGFVGRGVFAGDCGFLSAETTFGVVEIGSPETIAVLVGNNTLVAQDFGFGDHCNAFTVLGANPISVPAGQVGQFAVEFEPVHPGEYVSQIITDCGSSSWLHGTAVSATPKAGPSEISPTSTGVSMRVGPNPMQGDAAIRFANAGRDPISAELRIVDLRGRVLFSQPMEIPSGGHQWRWDGRDRDGQSVAAGVYFIELVAPGTTVRQKVTVLR